MLLAYLEKGTDERTANEEYAEGWENYSQVNPDLWSHASHLETEELPKQAIKDDILEKLILQVMGSVQLSLSETQQGEQEKAKLTSLHWTSMCNMIQCEWKILW